MKRPIVYVLVAIAVLVLTIIPVGTAVFVLGFGAGDSPCVLCWEQRIGMLLIALTGLFVLRFGPRPKYVGVGVTVSAWGIFMGMRHAGMHAARDIGQGFALEILGAHTYTWSLLIYWICAVTMGALLLLTDEREWETRTRTTSGLETLAMWVFLVVVSANVVQAFASTGPPPFVGQSDPVRFSFRPSTWVWSLEEWKPARITFRGRWGASKPDASKLTRDPAAGPLSPLTPLRVVEQRRLALPLRGGAPTGLAYDDATRRFAISTELGVHVVDAAFSQVVRYTVIDPGFSVDMGRLGDLAFLDSHTVAALGENKSYAILREHDGADARQNFRFFLESFDRFDEVARGRLSTVRARLMYVLSVAFDPSTNSLYSVTVPNETTKTLVVSRFDRRDMTLSEEFSPSLAAASGLAFRAKDRTLDELYVGAATVHDGRLYAASPAFSTLLVIDPKTRDVVAANELPGAGDAVGLAIAGGRLNIITRDSQLIVYALQP